ncbi:1-phosphofructokinase family hexose kinase [Gottschalkiaceae bacterium SANA]|nr:1-phosphofructokinase family hexose kinase [Gottschalkiaceae bacterium SANA]
MILTITANPAIDARYFLNQFEVNQVVRCETYNKTAGGKGLNVARVVDRLGEEVTCGGFVGGRNGDFIRETIQVAGYEDHFVTIGEETRVCLGILGADGTQTEILERGPVVTEAEQEQFFKRLPKMLAGVKVLTISGSLPAGVYPSFYGKLVGAGKEAGVTVILDTSGEAFRSGIQAGPDFIKPNREELSAYFGRDIESKGQAIEAAKELIEEGVGAVAVSLGGQGAVLVSQGSVIEVEIPQISVVNPVGSGDSFVAGFAVALSRKNSLKKAMRLACACGTANALEEKTGWIELEKVEQISKELIVSEKKA